MRILTDFHHAGLLNSLILLFEKRLGHSVFRPIGREWYDSGFWKVYDHPATVAQYLDVWGATPDDTPELNDPVSFGVNSDEREPSVYYCQDVDSGETNKAITLKGFLNTHFDIVIASIPQHIEPFKRLCETHPSKPKLIFQIGNQWDGKNTAKNIMASVKMGPIEGTNFISYHQEFDLDIFSPDFNYPVKNIFSFVNNFQNDQMFQKDWQLFEKMEKLMPDWTFKSFGGQCRDGWCNGAKEIAKTMKDAMFVWHTKAGGDGYGHIVHNTGAVARPMIVKTEYYKDKLGMDLMIDGVTCLAIDRLNPQQIVNKITHFSTPPRYAKMQRAIYDNFTKKVDFEKEAIEIQRFIDSML